MSYYATIVNTGANGLGGVVNEEAAQAVATKHFGRELDDVIEEFGFGCKEDLDSPDSDHLPSNIEDFYDVLAAGFDGDTPYSWTYSGEDGEVWTIRFYQGGWKSVDTETIAVDVPADASLLEKLAVVAEMNEESVIGALLKEAADALTAIES